MEIVHAKDVEVIRIPAPYSRCIQRIFDPNTHGVEEMSLGLCSIDPDSGTDYHKHDRPELIIIASGKGICVCEGEDIPVETDTFLWVRKDEMHQMKNTSPDEIMKLITGFIPPQLKIAAMARYQKEKAEGKI